MNSDFSSPQRQSLVGVLIMFANTLQKSVRALFPLLIVFFVNLDKIEMVYVWLGGSAVFLLVAVIAYLRYLNFTFHLDEENEEFVIKDGIWNKNRLAIPLDKIQQVNINQSILQKLVGVHALEVDTAGSGKQEVSIKAISRDIALALKERLLENERMVNTVDAGEGFESETLVHQTQQPFVKISFLSLLKTGITSNYARTIALLLAFLITTFQHIDEFIEYSGYEDDPFDHYISLEVVLRFLAFIIIGIFALVLVLNLSRTILKFYGFIITKQKDTLLLSYGLLNTKNTILRPDKVQIVSISRNYFQKKLDIQDIKVRQASNKESNDQEQKKTAIEIPGCNEVEKDKLMEFLLGEVPQRGEMVKPDIRYIIFPGFMLLLLPLLLYFLAVYAVGPSLLDYILFVPVYVVIVSALIYFAFRHSRLYVDKEYIVKQGGAWDIDNEFVAPHKIQTVKLQQFFWQKYSNVGVIKIYTAGGTVSFGLANYTKLKQLANLWLYKVETAGKHWM